MAPIFTTFPMKTGCRLEHTLFFFGIWQSLSDVWLYTKKCIGSEPYEECSSSEAGHHVRWWDLGTSSISRDQEKHIGLERRFFRIDRCICRILWSRTVWIRLCPWLTLLRMGRILWTDSWGSAGQAWLRILSYLYRGGGCFLAFWEMTPGVGIWRRYQAEPHTDVVKRPIR